MAMHESRYTLTALRKEAMRTHRKIAARGAKMRQCDMALSGAPELRILLTDNGTTVVIHSAWIDTDGETREVSTAL